MAVLKKSTAASRASERAACKPGSAQWLHWKGSGKGIECLDYDFMFQAAAKLNERVKQVTLHELSPLLATYGDAVNQLQRSALSVWLNAAEGNGRITPRGVNQFWRIALGSVYETYAVMKMLEFSEEDLELAREVARLLEAEVLSNDYGTSPEDAANFMEHNGGHRET